GEMMPWGAPVEKDRNCGESVVHGAGNFLKSTWDGAKAMVGFGPEGFSVDTLASTWVGVADFVGSTALLASPVLSQGIKFFGGDEVDRWVDERHDVAKTALGSFVGYDHQAAKEGGDGWHRWKEDGVAALTESVLNIGTCFIPGAGQVGAATKVGLAGTKVALAGSKVSTVASVAAKVTKVTVKVADNLIPGGGHLVEGVAKVVNAGADTVRGVDDVAAVKPAKMPGAPAAHTPVTNTLDLAGGNRVVTNGPNLMQDVKAPKVPASPVGDVADLAGEAGTKKTPKVDTALEGLEGAEPTTAPQRPKASGPADGLDSSRVPESRSPEGPGSKAPEADSSRMPEPERVKVPEPEASRVPDADSAKAPHTPESRGVEAETTRTPEGAGAKAPEVESSKLPKPDRAKTVDVEASRAPEADAAKTPEASGTRTPEIETSRTPEAGAGKSPDVPEAERVPQEAGTRGVDDAVDVDARRSPEAGDAVDGLEGRHSSTEPDGGEGTAARETASGEGSETTTVRDPNQWPGEELAPGAERRAVPKGDRDWWYDEDGYPHEKGDHHPESTYRDVEGKLQNKNGGFVTDTNPPEKPDLIESRRELSDHPEGYREHLDTITDDHQTTYTEDLKTRNQLQQEHLADFRSLKTLVKDADISIKGFTVDTISKNLEKLADSGKLNHDLAKKIEEAFLTERDSLGKLQTASEGLGVRATDGLVNIRSEISLYGPNPTSGSKLLDQVGVTLDPPSITVYEAKGIGGDLGDIEIDGKRYQQGTSEYLQQLMKDDPRFAQGLEDLIRREGPGAEALIKAIRNGELTINYDLVHAKANGTIEISRFILDTKPTLPDITLP
ncbi:hypothetical protein EII34_14280, partial [Arachnia propionica]